MSDEQMRAEFESTRAIPAHMTYNEVMNRYYAHDHIQRKAGQDNLNREWEAFQNGWQAARAQSEEPAAWTIRDSLGSVQDLFDCPEEAKRVARGDGGSVIPLYTHPPAREQVPSGLEEKVLAEMDRRFELPDWDDDHMVIHDTQIGVEFAIDQITKELAAAPQPPAQGWKPIDQAPRDGTKLLLGLWVDWPQPEWVQEVKAFSNLDVARQGEGSQHSRATHFMYLPEPPEE